MIIFVAGFKKAFSVKRYWNFWKYWKKNGHCSFSHCLQ